MAVFKCSYVGGPFDGSVLKHSTCPQDGERIVRRARSQDVLYIFDQGKGRYVFRGFYSNDGAKHGKGKNQD